MEITDYLKSSEYGLSLFSEADIAELKSRISLRNTGKSKGAYIQCLVRDKEVKLTPEEIVRQLYAKKLMSDYGYDKYRLAFEYTIFFGREAKRADIVAYLRSLADTPAELPK